MLAFRIPKAQMALSVRIPHLRRSLASNKDIILWSLHIFKTPCNMELCIGISLFRCFAEPMHCLSIVQRNPFPFEISQTQIELRFCVALLGCLLIPFRSLGQVLFNSFAVKITNTQITLPVGTTFFCRLLYPAYWTTMHSVLFSHKSVVPLARCHVPRDSVQCASIAHRLHCGNSNNFASRHRL